MQLSRLQRSPQHSGAEQVRANQLDQAQLDGLRESLTEEQRRFRELMPHVRARCSGAARIQNATRHAETGNAQDAACTERRSVGPQAP
jgi:hypothetical protein